MQFGFHNITLDISWLYADRTDNNTTVTEEKKTVFPHDSFNLVLQRFVDESGQVDYSALKKDPLLKQLSVFVMRGNFCRLIEKIPYARLL